MTVFGGSGGNADEVVVRGTAARDLFEINQGTAVATVLANNVTAWLPVQLGTNVPVLTAQGLGGQDTFQVTPGAGIGAFPLDNLLINIDGGGDASGENNALVIQSAAGGTLAANQFVVVNRGAAANSGTVRTLHGGRAQRPDINYVNVQVVSPNVANAPAGNLNAGQPNLLIMGPDLNEPNEYQANATFVGSGATLQIQHASIFPNYQRISRGAQRQRLLPRGRPDDRHARFPGLLPVVRPDAAAGRRQSQPPSAGRQWQRHRLGAGNLRRGRRNRQRPRPHPGRCRAELLPARLRPAARRRPRAPWSTATT